MGVKGGGKNRAKEIERKPAFAPDDERRQGQGAGRGASEQEGKIHMRE